VNRRGGTIGSGSKLGNGPEFLHCVQAGLDAGGRQILTIYIDAIHAEDGVSGAASGQGRAFTGGKSRRGTRTCFRAGGESEKRQDMTSVQMQLGYLPGLYELADFRALGGRQRSGGC